MAASPQVNRARFARFIARVLADARLRGMTDRSIADATGIPPSTFHRWQKGQFVTAPDLDKVQRFCAGLGVPARAALLALGITEEPDEAEPEPALPPDVRRILRALADPNVPDEEKRIIVEMLKMIAARIRNVGKSSPNLTDS